MAASGREEVREGWLVDRWCKIGWQEMDTGLVLRIPGAGRFWMDFAAHQVALLPNPRQDDPDPDFLEQVLIGPVLILGLAALGRHCLHASAVSYDDGVLAFSAESGSGKSTLARFLSQRWDAVADDILPIANDADGVMVLPRYPQLKWPADSQYPAEAPASLPLRALFLLRPESSEGDGDPSVERLSAAQAIPALVRHTIASRLYNRWLLGRHLAFCRDVALRLPVYRLSYPKRFDSLPRIECALRMHLASIDE